MATLLVGYDLNRPGQDYPDLIQKLKSYGTWWHHLDSTWLVVTELNPRELRDALLPFVDDSDELLVLDVTGDAGAWHGFKSRGSDWLTEHL